MRRWEEITGKSDTQAYQHTLFHLVAQKCRDWKNEDIWKCSNENDEHRMEQAVFEKEYSSEVPKKQIKC